MEVILTAYVSSWDDPPSIPLEPTFPSFFGGYDPYPLGLKTLMFLMVLGSKGIGDEILPSYVGITLPETNSLHLKVDGWNIVVSFWDGLFSGAMLVSGRVYYPVNNWDYFTNHYKDPY